MSHLIIQFVIRKELLTEEDNKESYQNFRFYIPFDDISKEIPLVAISLDIYDTSEKHFHYLGCSQRTNIKPTLRGICTITIMNVFVTMLYLKGIVKRFIDFYVIKSICIKII